MTQEHHAGIPGVSSPQIDQIAAALAKAQGQVKPVVKDREGKVTGTTKAGKFYEYTYKYAGLDAVYDALREVAERNGLSAVQRFAPNNHLHVLLLHTSGQWIDYGLYPLGNAEKHQDRGGAISYARRYAMACVFGIAPHEDDEKIGDESLGRKELDWPKSVFATEELRREFCDNTRESFQKAENFVKLTELAELSAKRFAEMSDSPNEHDRMAVEDLRRCFAIEKARLIPAGEPAKPKTVDQAVAKGAK